MVQQTEFHWHYDECRRLASMRSKGWCSFMRTKYHARKMQQGCTFHL